MQTQVANHPVRGAVLFVLYAALGGIALLAYAFRHLHRLLEQADQQVSAAIDADADDPPRTL